MILTQEQFEANLQALYEGAISDGASVEGDELDKEERASQAYLAALPALTSRRSVQFYIAAVAQGLQTGLISGNDSKRLLHIAQLALGAFGTRNEGPVLPPTRGVASR